MLFNLRGGEDMTACRIHAQPDGPPCHPDVGES
jgi:hypothetical protein